MSGSLLYDTAENFVRLALDFRYFKFIVGVSFTYSVVTVNT